METPEGIRGNSGKQETVPAETPVVVLDPSMKEELLSSYMEEGVVIVHCSFSADEDTLIRIWTSTVLIDRTSGNRSRFLHALNITVAPDWMPVKGGATARFTLFFAPLPRSCEVFDMYEDIPQPGGFLIKNIRRNRQDVYRVAIV